MKHIKEILLISLMLVAAFAVRLYRFNNPVADWHSWRQADTAAVTRNFVKYGFDLLHPRIDNISNVQTGKYENPKGYFFTEFPLYNAVSAGLFVTFHHFTIEQWGRLVSIVSSLITLLFLYLLTRKYAGIPAAFFTGFFYAFLPFGIYYSRTILPGPFSDAALLTSLYVFDLALERKKQILLLILSGVLLAIAILVRPFAAFFILPFLYLSFQKWGVKVFLQWKLYIFAFLAVVPFALWRLWMRQYPEGIPSSDWLFNGGNIRFTGAFFYWIFSDRLARLILGDWGIVLFVLGIIWKRKNNGFFLSFLLSSLLYLTVIARGNVQHDYYQFAIMPTVALLCGLGGQVLFSSLEFIHRYYGRIMLFVCIAFSLSFSWYYVRDYFNVNNPNIVTAGKVVDRLTPKDAKVIALYNGDSSFLYQVNRFGWASFEKSLSEMMQLGAGYIVIVNPTKNDFTGFGSQYQTIASSDAYLLLDITHKK